MLEHSRIPRIPGMMSLFLIGARVAHSSYRHFLGKGLNKKVPYLRATSFNHEGGILLFYYRVFDWSFRLNKKGGLLKLHEGILLFRGNNNR